jgi:hypothetical protein
MTGGFNFDTNHGGHVLGNSPPLQRVQSNKLAYSQRKQQSGVALNNKQVVPGNTQVEADSKQELEQHSMQVSFSNLAEYRKSRGLDMNQSDFWKRLGITQSGGSRYEAGRNVSKPVQLLLALIDLGIVTEDSLEKARKVIAKASQ